MDKIEVVEVDSPTRLGEFIRYPRSLYRDEPCYVVPLFQERKEFFDFDRNPFYRAARVKLFLAKRNGRPAGRIATCINFKHNEYHSEQVGFFGFFDTPDDYEIARSLLKVAMITLKREGMEKMRGPMNFSTNHECGFLVEGYGKPPVVMMTYNRPHQVRLCEKFGLKKVMDLMAYLRTDDEAPSDRIMRVVNKMRKRSTITVRPIDMSDFNAEVDRLREIYNSAWAPNWGFVPMDEAEFNHMAKNLRQIVDPDIVLIAEHKGRPAAFSIALPDVNQALAYLKGRLLPFGILRLIWHTKIRNKINGIRMITMGVVPRYQRLGIDSLLYVETFERAVARGYKWAELSWILESNELMCRGAVDMGARLYKKYRILEMPL
ncbi:MAG: N-acetyltransferase [Candidatus Zixiibacteriota bacterium]|nr:MAG: N-acetyltransferase [candidate division Zixibacteria bacterium]